MQSPLGSPAVLYHVPPERLLVITVDWAKYDDTQLDSPYAVGRGDGVYRSVVTIRYVAGIGSVKGTTKI
jgi:hypothetical protein